MKNQEKKKPYKRIALLFSLCALVIWCILGTGASLAWFADSSPEINNIFHVADFNLDVFYRTVDGSWQEVNCQTVLFDPNAKYEPGYVQTVYLRIENKGDRAFEFFTAVNVNGYTLATNAFGQQFNLQDYLRFGVVSANTEEKMENSVPSREEAEWIADKPLHNYETETAVLEPGGISYLALIVRMPKEVGNIANYRGDDIPTVELGITVRADQIKN